MISLTKKSNAPVIKAEDFYNRILALRLRNSRRPIPSLSKYLNHDFRRVYFKIEALATLIKLSQDGCVYLRSYGTKRRRLPENLKATNVYHELKLKKREIVEEEDEYSVCSDQILASSKCQSKS